MKNVPHKTGSLIGILLVIVVSLAVYANTLSNFFVYDDFAVVVDNASIKQWNNLPSLFNSNYFRSFGEFSYRPVVTLTYFLDYWLWQLKPVGYHLTNLLLHTLNGVLLYFLLLGILKRPGVSLASALLFTGHPVTSEAVNAIGFREDLLAFAFCLLSFLAYLKISSSNSRRKGYMLLSAGAFFLALFSKEMALILPLLFLVYELCFRRDFLSAVREKRAFYFGLLLVLGFYCLVRFCLLQHPAGPEIPPVPLYLRILRMSRIIFFYLRLLLLPFRLSVEYVCPIPSSFREPAVLLSVLGLLAVTALSVRNFRRFPEFVFGGWWFFLALLPVSSLIPLYNPAAERYLYIPAVGFCLVLGLAGEALFIRMRAPAKYLLPVILLSILISYSVRTTIRNRDWKDALTFCRKTIATCPESARFHNNLGCIYNAAGKKEEALTSFKKAAELDPDDAEVYINLGVAYNALGRMEEAAVSLKKAVELDPDYAAAHYNFGMVYHAAGKNEEAIASFEKAVELDPDFAEAYNNLGAVYNAAGKREEAIAACKKAIELRPGYARAYNNLGNVYRALGRKEAAIAAYKNSLELDRDEEIVYCNLGMVYEEAGRREEAIASFRKAIEFNPAFARAHFNLAMLFYYQKKYKLAVKYCDRAIDLGYRADPELLKLFAPYRK